MTINERRESGIKIVNQEIRYVKQFRKYIYEDIGPEVKISVAVAKQAFQYRRNFLTSSHTDLRIR